MTPEQFAAFERIAAILEAVAGECAPDSERGVAIRRAALALMYVSMEHAEAFELFLEKADQPPSEDPEEYIRQLRAKAKKA